MTSQADNGRMRAGEPRAPRRPTMFQQILADNARDMPDQARQIREHEARMSADGWPEPADPGITTRVGALEELIDQAATRHEVGQKLTQVDARLRAVEAVPATPTPAYDWRADLIGRLTSRKFLLTVAGVLIVIVAVATGALTVDDALSKLQWIIGVFIAGESAVDAVTAARGHAPAGPPRETPHAD